MQRTKLSDIHKQRIALALMGNKNSLGHKHSKETRSKIREKRLIRKERLGYINSPESRKKMSKVRKGRPAWNKGIPFSKKAREKMSFSAFKRFSNPENHPRWLNGKSFEPYPIQFTKQNKTRVKIRDNFICQLCGVKEKDYFQKLSIHHIDYDKKNCDINNLLTLCRSCNAKVNTNRKKWIQFFKDKVQRL